MITRIVSAVLLAILCAGVMMESGPWTAGAVFLIFMLLEPLYARLNDERERKAARLEKSADEILDEMR